MVAMYSKLSPQAPFIMAVIVCSINMCMIFVIVERRQAPAEWFGQQEDKEKTAEEDLVDIKPSSKVSTMVLFKSARLWTALYLTLTVAIAMSSSEVRYMLFGYI